MGQREVRVDSSDPLKLSCTSSPSERLHPHHPLFPIRKMLGTIFFFFKLLVLFQFLSVLVDCCCLERVSLKQLFWDSKTSIRD